MAFRNLAVAEVSENMVKAQQQKDQLLEFDQTWYGFGQIKSW